MSVWSWKGRCWAFTSVVGRWSSSGGWCLQGVSTRPQGQWGAGPGSSASQMLGPAIAPRSGLLPDRQRGGGSQMLLEHWDGVGELPRIFRERSHTKPRSGFSTRRGRRGCLWGLGPAEGWGGPCFRGQEDRRLPQSGMMTPRQ